MHSDGIFCVCISDGFCMHSDGFLCAFGRIFCMHSDGFFVCIRTDFLCASDGFVCMHFGRTDGQTLPVSLPQPDARSPNDSLSACTSLPAPTDGSRHDFDALCRHTCGVLLKVKKVKQCKNISEIVDKIRIFVVIFHEGRPSHAFFFGYALGRVQGSSGSLALSLFLSEEWGVRCVLLCIFQFATPNS